MKTRTASTAETPAALLEDLRALVSDAEIMLNAEPANDCAETGALLRARFAALQARCNYLYARARTTLLAGAKCTDHAIRANPYQALAIALGLGLLLGMRLGPRGQ
jgi:ElaB/YqjD/DUF883 family membrane-anchored ribosome-binding protein